MRKSFGPTNFHEKKLGTHVIPTEAQWHGGTTPTRPTIARDPWNLPHSCFIDCFSALFI